MGVAHPDSNVSSGRRLKCAARITGPAIEEALEGRQLFSAFFVNMTSQSGPESVPGYMMDVGGAYGERTDVGSPGVFYGWIDSTTKAPVDNTVNSRNRGSSTHPLNPLTPIPELYDSFNHMQKFPPPLTWEIAVPNGSYVVHIASGDPINTDSRYQMLVEGVQAYDFTPTNGNFWGEGVVTVAVADGKLTISTGPDATNSKLDFVEATQVPEPAGFLVAAASVLQGLARQRRRGRSIR